MSSTSAFGLDVADKQAAEHATSRGIAFFRQTQNDNGSWSPDPGPAVTALIVTAMLEQPHIEEDDLAVYKALGYILARRHTDGSIHDGFLPNYNTAICLSALSMVPARPGVADAVRKAQGYLRGLQWAGQPDGHGRRVDVSHPFYGGAGYGRHGRPDLSNTQIMLQGLHDSGLSCDDPAYQRALVFISRCQGSASNHMFGKEIAGDGGFIYSTSVDRNLIGIPQSMANPESIGEAKAGRAVSGLRTYGSMTYAGFKSYIYIALDRRDPRVVDAHHWIRNHYTLDQNPGLPEYIKMQGYYYYLMTFARALRAWGPDTLTTADGRERHWPSDLIAKLVLLQRPDGSWTNEADRWLEGDPHLVTAYALIALNHAKR